MMNKVHALMFLIFGLNCFAQTKYFRINGGKPINETAYNKTKEVYARNGSIEELILKTEKKPDSIISYIKLGLLVTTPDGIDPYAETKKYVGTRFKIEKFKNRNSKNFSKNYLNGKPTFINFWFTKCPPCIDEIPELNELKIKYNEKVNFISITFDDKTKVDEFLKIHQFNFKHITNSKKQIDELGIYAYPTNLIIDENGIVKFVFGEITSEVKDIIVILDGISEK